MTNMLRNINKDPFIFTREKEDIKLKTEVYALSQSISMSAHKARRVLDQILGRSYRETLTILELMPYRACYPIFKLIYSAAANAKHNMGLNEEYLVITKATVNEGTTVKKLKPRARGRSYAIKRPTCHITIVLKDTALYEKYVVENSIRCLKKTGWIYKKKSTDITCHNMYSSGGVWDKKEIPHYYMVSDLVQPKVIIRFGLHNQKIIFLRGSTRRSKNTGLYQELCTKKYKNILWCRGNCTYRDSKKNRSDSGHNLYGIPKVISRR